MAEQTVEVTILGKTYTLTSDGDTELLERAANLLNHKISDINKTVGAASTQTALVLAALNLAEEYITCVIDNKGKYCNIQDKIVTMLGQIEKQVDEKKKVK